MPSIHSQATTQPLHCNLLLPSSTSQATTAQPHSQTSHSILRTLQPHTPKRPPRTCYLCRKLSNSNPGQLQPTAIDVNRRLEGHPELQHSRRSIQEVKSQETWAQFKRESPFAFTRHGETMTIKS